MEQTRNVSGCCERNNALSSDAPTTKVQRVEWEEPHKCVLGTILRIVGIIEMIVAFLASIFMQPGYHFSLSLFLGILVGGMVSGLMLLALSKLVNAADKYLES